jgi:hypothetical protein
MNRLDMPYFIPAACSHGKRADWCDDTAFRKDPFTKINALKMSLQCETSIIVNE